MADNESFFRKVVRFVANPATDWTELNSRQDDVRELELEKSELKAMIERKRRNDFVRKREFDVLRRVRREGLTPEQLAALGTSSRLDDSGGVRAAESALSRPAGVKAKIDEIEQQMVGEGHAGASRSRSGTSRHLGLATTPGALPRDRADRARDRGERATAPSPLDRTPRAAPTLPPLAQPLPPARAAPPAAPAPVQMAGGLPPLAPPAPVSFDATIGAGAADVDGGGGDFGSPFAVEVSEVVHDPELDEAVIAFANADFAQCEEALRRITGPGGGRGQHAETWLVLFDLYRATGQQQRFESLAVDYAQQFGWSAPQWYSLPKLVAEAIADEPVVPSTTPRDGADIGWICPPRLDVDAVADLRSQTLQMPLPWVFDWSGLQSIDAESAMQLAALLRQWAGQPLEIRWIAGERLFAVLQEAAPNGVRDADPAFWLTRLDALRLANRPDQFDEAAIDYCMTYEVSPPSWEPTRCKLRIAGSGLSTRTPPLSMVSEVSTSFLDSALFDEPGGSVEVAHVELTGQLVGDIGATLTKLQTELGTAPIVSVSCARLIRVDFIAAGDLLNWVLARAGESRSVQFVDTHRLVALFFGAMGINEHAKVQVRKV